MSVQTQINRLRRNVSDAFGAVGDMGGTVPEQTVSDNLASAIYSIRSGGSASETDVFVVAIDYEHNTASHSPAEIKAAYESGKVVITMDKWGMLLSLYDGAAETSVFEGIYSANGGLNLSRITVGADKRVVLEDGPIGSAPPHFDLSEMGMPPIPMPAGSITFRHDMTALADSITKGVTSIRIPCNTGGHIFYFDCHILGHKHTETDAIQVSTTAFLYNELTGESHGNFLVTAIIFGDRAIINVEPFNASGGSGNSGIVFVNIDQSTMKASHSASQIQSAKESGYFVLAIFGTQLCTLVACFDSTAHFAFNAPLDGYMTTMRLSVSENKTVETEMFEYPLPVYVNTDENNMADMSVAQINAMAAAGCHIYLRLDGALFTYQGYSGNTAVFVNVVGNLEGYANGSHVISTAVVSENREVTVYPTRGLLVPLPGETDSGKVLTNAAEGLKWVTPPQSSGSGGGFSIPVIDCDALGFPELNEDTWDASKKEYERYVEIDADTYNVLWNKVNNGLVKLRFTGYGDRMTITANSCLFESASPGSLSTNAATAIDRWMMMYSFELFTPEPDVHVAMWYIKQL